MYYFRNIFKRPTPKFDVKSTNNMQNTTQKSKDQATRTPRTSGGWTDVAPVVLQWNDNIMKLQIALLCADLYHTRHHTIVSNS